MKLVTIYTDGACVGNPGPGGYGVVLLFDGRRKELSRGFRRTTNNRMEILAAIAGLEALREQCKVMLYSDSQYIVNGMQEGWAKRWQANNWKRGKSGKALNPDLWQRLLDLCDKHQVEFKWLKGHVGTLENERCDKLAVQAAKRTRLAVDTVYEAGNPAT